MINGAADRTARLSATARTGFFDMARRGRTWSAALRCGPIGRLVVMSTQRTSCPRPTTMIHQQDRLSGLARFSFPVPGIRGGSRCESLPLVGPCAASNRARPPEQQGRLSSFSRLQAVLDIAVVRLAGAKSSSRTSEETSRIIFRILAYRHRDRTAGPAVFIRFDDSRVVTRRVTSSTRENL